MKERPILFSGPMVRALLDGSKTQTRRVCKQAANLSAVVAVQDPTSKEIGQRPPYFSPGWFGDEDGEAQFFSPYGAAGDRLWVRETWDAGGNDIGYRADMSSRHIQPTDAHYLDSMRMFDRQRGQWRPSIHMPRWASRITLEITCVRIERLQDISEEDAVAEGVSVHPDHHGKPRTSIYSPVQAYRDLWESISGPGSWDLNPWVWVVEFKRAPSAPSTDGGGK